MTDKNPPKLFGVIEADETYVGGKPRGHRLQRIQGGRTMSEAIKESWDKKTPVFGIKERGGRVRAKMIKNVNQRNVEREVFHGVDRERSRLMTDEHPVYQQIKHLLPHEIIRHKSEYVRGEVHTQGIESFWAVLKRGLIGTYHHVDEGYLNQYVQEFAFRANTRKIQDGERFATLMGQIDGRVDWYVGKNAKPSSSAS
jgi:hypothetical protein